MSLAINTTDLSAFKRTQASKMPIRKHESKKQLAKKALMASRAQTSAWRNRSRASARDLKESGVRFTEQDQLREEDEQEEQMWKDYLDHVEEFEDSMSFYGDYPREAFSFAEESEETFDDTQKNLDKTSEETLDESHEEEPVDLSPLSPFLDVLEDTKSKDVMAFRNALTTASSIEQFLRLVIAFSVAFPQGEMDDHEYFHHLFDRLHAYYHTLPESS